MLSHSLAGQTEPIRADEPASEWPIRRFGTLAPLVDAAGVVRNAYVTDVAEVALALLTLNLRVDAHDERDDQRHDDDGGEHEAHGCVQRRHPQ